MNTPEVTALLKAFDQTGIKFNDKAVTLAALKEQGEIVFTEDGPKINYRGKVQPMHEALIAHALANREQVDARTLPRDVQDSKENYTSTRSKVDFIEKHGEDAWANLPTSSVVVPTVIRYQDDFRKLPLSEKSRLLNEDPDYVTTLPARPDPNRTETGTFVNRAFLERQKKICPSRS